MGLLYDYSKGEPFHPNGIGMARPKHAHQDVLLTAAMNMAIELKSKGYKILPESTVTTDWDDLAPDLVIFDKSMHPLCMIEIVTHRQVHADIEKCNELMSRFPNAQYFVYDYEKKVLYMYAHESEEWVSSEDYELYFRYLSQPMISYFID